MRVACAACAVTRLFEYGRRKSDGGRQWAYRSFGCVRYKQPTIV